MSICAANLYSEGAPMADTWQPPPLPEPAIRDCCDAVAPPALFTAEQMRAYGEAAFRAGMERAAGICDERAMKQSSTLGRMLEAQDCANAIRVAGA
jgi:hypothetical protein